MTSLNFQFQSVKGPCFSSLEPSLKPNPRCSCVPAPLSKEALLVLVQGVLLVSRTLLTDYISRVEGYCGRALVSQQFGLFGQSVLGLAVVGIPAAVVNSGLKFMQVSVQGPAGSCR